MNKYNIAGIGVIRSYGFVNGSYFTLQEDGGDYGEIRVSGRSDCYAEQLALHFGIQSEDEMNELIGTTLTLDNYYYEWDGEITEYEWAELYDDHGEYIMDVPTGHYNENGGDE